MGPLGLPAPLVKVSLILEQRGRKDTATWGVVIVNDGT